MKPLIITAAIAFASTAAFGQSAVSPRERDIARVVGGAIIGDPVHFLEFATRGQLCSATLQSSNTIISVCLRGAEVTHFLIKESPGSNGQTKFHIEKLDVPSIRGTIDTSRIGSSAPMVGPAPEMALAQALADGARKFSSELNTLLTEGQIKSAKTRQSGPLSMGSTYTAELVVGRNDRTFGPFTFTATLVRTVKGDFENGTTVVVTPVRQLTGPRK